MSFTSNFSNRYNLSEIVSNNLYNLFDKNEVELIPFGFENISKGNIELNKFINEPESNMSHPAMMVKFAPDFILFKKKEPKEIYFLEIKVSITPLCGRKNFEEIKQLYSDIKVSDIGLIAREAWNAYNTLFPNTIILSATTYNPTLLKAQFVNKIKCLRCNGKNGMEDCEQCPIKSQGFFEYSRNYSAEGSQTQHTNIDLSSLVELKNFFKSLDLKVNTNTMSEIENILKKHGVKFPKNIYDGIKLKIIEQLKKEGCEWL